MNSGEVAPFSIGAVCFFEGHLYINNQRDNLIDEFNVSSFPIEFTGHTVPLDDAGCAFMHNLCVTRQHGEKRFILLYTDNKGMKKIMKCMDFTGKEIWKIDDRQFDEMKLHPRDICTDDKGNIFLADSTKNNVVC